MSTPPHGFFVYHQHADGWWVLPNYTVIGMSAVHYGIEQCDGDSDDWYGGWPSYSRISTALESLKDYQYGCKYDRKYKFRIATYYPAQPAFGLRMEAA